MRPVVSLAGGLRVNPASSFVTLWGQTVLGLVLVAIVVGGYWVKIRPSAETATQGDQGALMRAGLDALYTRNDAPAAVEQFRKVLALNPAHYGATLQLAKALDRAGRGDEARPYWDKMLKMAEDARDEESLATVRKRLQQRDTITEGGLMRAGLDALYGRKDPSAAAIGFRKVLERNPSHYGATFQLAMALDRAGQPAEARPLWEKTLKMAEASNDGKTAALARERLAKADQVSPQDAAEDALMKVGLAALYSRNDPVAAEIQFRKVLKLNPTHYGATFQLARALDRMGQASEARPLWEKALRMAEERNDQQTIAAVRARLAGKP